MTRLIADAALKARLEGLKEMVEVCDETGKTLGYLSPPIPRELRSPFSEEEIRERRKDRTGRSLADIMRDLESR